jgi:hypothetical protein
MTSAVQVAILVLLYVVVYMSVLITSGGFIMASFDGGIPVSGLGSFLHRLSFVLGLPLLPLVPVRWFPDITGYIPLLLNGWIWALLVVRLSRLLRSFKLGRSAAAA